MRVHRTPPIRRFVITCAGVIAFALSGQRALLRAEILDRVLAVVANNVITLTDVNAAQDLGLQKAAAGDRRDQLVADWIAALRRRGDIIDLYLPTTRN